MTGLKAETILWPVYIDYEYEDWTYGTAIEEYGEQAKAVGVNVFLVNSILREGKLRSEGRAIHFKNGRIMNKLLLGEEGLLVCELS